MKELIAFLHARLDEDEGVARGEITRREVWQRKLDQMRRVGEMIGVGLVDFDGPGAPGDPVRVLAEVEANRRIINLCEEWEEWVEIGEITPRATWSDEVAGGAVARVLSLMALPYADHPDYDPAWAPASAVSTACYCAEINELCGHCKG